MELQKNHIFSKSLNHDWVKSQHFIYTFIFFTNIFMYFSAIYKHENAIFILSKTENPTLWWSGMVTIVWLFLQLLPMVDSWHWLCCINSALFTNLNIGIANLGKYKKRDHREEKVRNYLSRVICIWIHDLNTI